MKKYIIYNKNIAQNAIKYSGPYKGDCVTHAQKNNNLRKTLPNKTKRNTRQHKPTMSIMQNTNKTIKTKKRHEIMPELYNNNTPKKMRNKTSYKGINGITATKKRNSNITIFTPITKKYGMIVHTFNTDRLLQSDSPTAIMRYTKYYTSSKIIWKNEKLIHYHQKQKDSL